MLCQLARASMILPVVPRARWKQNELSTADARYLFHPQTRGLLAGLVEWNSDEGPIEETYFGPGLVVLELSE